MATTKPRITISLNPNVYTTLKRMSELGGQPMATIVSEMLETVHDPLMRTVAFLEAAAEAPKQVREGLRSSFERVERELYEVAGHSVAQMDFLTQEMMGKGREAPVSGAPSLPLRAKVNPHNVIRGSGLSQVSKIKHLPKGSKGVKK